MPFDFKKYDTKCAAMDADALQREWEHYTRLISGAATSTAVSGMAIPFTLGVSTIGVGLAAPAIHNARKKREIIERHLQRHGKTHHTRKRDVITAGAISGTVGVVTLGLAPVGADAICNSAASHGIAYVAENELGVKIATHLALDAAAVAAEETHMHSRKEQEAWKAYAQAVKEGKNPSLPTSDLKMPVNPTVATNDFKPNQQNDWYQAAPPICVIPPSDQKPCTTATSTNYQNPPYQADAKTDILSYRRNSTSTIPLDTKPSPSVFVQPEPNGHLMFGTTTAISAPMVGGQSYGLQLAPQSPALPPRPSSAIGGGMLSTGPLQFSSKSDRKTQQNEVFPQSPVLASPNGINVPQYQPLAHRPRASSTISFSGPPTYEMQGYIQSPSGTSQVPLPPPSPPPSMPTSPPPPSYTPNPPASGYFTASTPTGHLSYSQPFQFRQSATYDAQPTWSTPYNPNDYVASYQQQQQNLHGPAELVYSAQEFNYQNNDPKIPIVHQHQIQNPASPIQYATPEPYANYAHQPGVIVTQHMPYFPPPPPAY